MNEESILTSYNGKDAVITATQLRAEIKAQPKPPELYSGISMLDNATHNFQAGEIVIVSGPTGHGKTSFCKFLISRFSEISYKPMYFGAEGMCDNFFDKFPQPMNEFYMSREFIKANLEWLEERIKEGKLKYGCDIVFIDHLHYMLDMAKLSTGNTSILIGGFMRELVKMVKRQNVLCFLVAHLTKSVFTKPPCISDIRDSSFVTQEADMVLLIWRKMNTNDKSGAIEFCDNRSTLSIQKSRRSGVLRTFELEYNGGVFKQALDPAPEPIA